MLTTIEIDGCWYHAQPSSGDTETGDILTWDLILNEDGSPIPAEICLCHAHSSSECCCGAWSVEDDYH
jgi:hypothetical protein